ncbi:LssY C-terminal domain-containing protein [Sphingomonas paeninsulae]|jgi:hypothetical protein|nr:LssY C-terminal domain-containing protein [Sphingomonas paeninsulae]
MTKHRGLVVFLSGLLVVLLGYSLLPRAWQFHERRVGSRGIVWVTHTKQGIPGDPINITLQGSQTEVACLFHRAGWLPASGITARSSMKIVDSVAFHRPDPSAPVSALYFEGRREDFAFEKEVGNSAKERHHVRLWRSGAASDTNDRTIWFASASFDRAAGVNHYTFRATHHIDPNLDAERDFLSNALVATGRTGQPTKVPGIGATQSGHNGGGDRYFTDGKITVLPLKLGC